MVYDCFTFFNELDILETRLNELSKVVDFFIIVESNYTFSGKQKPLYFNQNKHRFKEFTNKIIHIVVDDLLTPPDTANLPPFSHNRTVVENSEYWNREFYQRNCIMRGLTNAKNDDIILIGDVDEIPKPQIISNLRVSNKSAVFKMNVYYYYLNCKSDQVDNCTRAIKYSNLKKTTPQVIRWQTPKECIVINDGGWHFSYMGNPKTIKEKIGSFSHQELNNSKYIDTDSIKFNIDNNLDLFHRRIEYNIVSIDDSFPKYVFLNQDKFKHLIKSKKRFNKNTITLQKVVKDNRMRIDALSNQIILLNQSIQENQEQIKYYSTVISDIKHTRFYILWQKYLIMKSVLLGKKC